MSLYKSLSDEFDNGAGQLVDYTSPTSLTIDTKHYSLRSFYGVDLTVPRTMPDFRYWNAASYDGTQMLVLDQARSVTGRSIAARTMDSLDTMSTDLEDPTTLQDLENYILASGNEGWPSADPNVVLSQDSANRYANVMTVTVPQGSTKTVASTFRDDILTNLNDVGGTYYITLVLPAFPAQAATAHLDLANSFVDFTSDPSGSYGASQTDSVAFNASINSLTAGGNVVFQINRNTLTHANLAALTGIRFRLAPLGTGNVVVKFQAMRVFKSGDFDAGGVYPAMGIDTKRNMLGRMIPKNGAGQSELATGLTPVMWGTTRTKNSYEVFKLNSGHIPTSPNANTFSYYARYDAGDDSYIRFDFTLTSTQSRITLIERVAGVSNTIYATPANSNTLSNSTDYYAVFEVQNENIRGSLYSSRGAFFNQLLYTTGWFPITRIDRGYSGYDFNGYNYDFQIDWIKNRSAEFATFESLPFKSFTPVVGASLMPKASPPMDLSEQNYISSGDATVTIDSTKGDPPPSRKFVRSGASLFGGLQTVDFLFIGDPKFLTIDGDIFPTVTMNRTYRVVLIDKYDTVAFNAYIPNLKANQWNHFSIPVVANIAPANYRVVFQQIGFQADTFWLQNFQVNHDTVAWYLSPDAGLTYFPILGDATGIYNGVNFGNQGTDMTQLRVKAVALSDTAWIQGYELVPKYENPGHYDLFNRASTSSTRDFRLIGSQPTDNTTRSFRITGA